MDSEHCRGEVLCKVLAPTVTPPGYGQKFGKKERGGASINFSIGRAEPPINDSDKNSWRTINSLFPSPKIIHRINFIRIYLLFVFLKNNTSNISIIV